MREGLTIEEFVLHIVHQYGYFGLFLSLVLGIVGLPIPDEILMTYFGFLVSQGHFSFRITFWVAFCGSVLGMTLSYLIGRYFGFSLLQRYGRRRGVLKQIREVQSWYRRYGRFLLTIGYFIPGVRHFTAFTAGISKMSFMTFVLFSYTGGMLWTLTFILLGRMVGDHWMTIVATLHRWSVGATLALAMGLLGVAYLKWYRKT